MYLFQSLTLEKIFFVATLVDMPAPSFAKQTPAKLHHIAKELMALADDIERSAEAMKGLEITEMDFPKADSLSVGLFKLRGFTDGARDTLRDVGLEVAGGAELHIAMKSVLSDLREPRRKKTNQDLPKLTRKKKPDKRK